MKKFGKIILTCFVVLLCISVGLCFLPGEKTATADTSIKDTNVIYNSVRKEIEIDEKKVLDVTEYINVTYERAGINLGLSRNVSRLNLITRIVNGKTYKVKTISKLELISVTMDGSPEYNFVETTADYYYINTGADGDYKSGTHEYAIHYKYDMGEDFINDFDDLTFDIMDYGFRSPVRSFEATVKLPKEFLNGKDLDESVLTFRTNNMQQIGHEALNLEYDEQNLTFKMSFDRLSSKTGLTMQLILDQGYFDTYYAPSSLYRTGYIISFICLGAIIAIVLISRYGKRLVKPVEFMPPEGASVTDVASAYRGKIKDQDFASLMIDFAHKGLVKIEIISKRHIIVHKLRDITSEDTPNKYERDYFNAIFKGTQKTFDTKAEKYKYDSDLNLAVRMIYDVDDGQKKKVVFLRFIIHVLALVPMIFYYIWSKNLGIGGVLPVFVVILFSQIAICVFLYTPIPIWFKIIWCGGFGGAPLGIFIAGGNIAYDVWGFVWVTLAIYLGGSALALFVRLFSNKQLAIRGRVLGFKNFLVKVEENRLKLLLEDNPEYFYDILPYCYIFNITNKMKKKFASLNVPEPVYASGSGYVAASAFSSLCSLSHATGASRSSSGGGGGGGGGGGSSGGGGGGGGCGGR